MQKGFTLFTALVGVLLVVIGVLLAQSMSSTEGSTTEIIAENRLDQEMIDAAVLAQADSLQEFNFSLRSAMEKYFSDPENGYKLDSDNWGGSGLDAIVDDFEQQHFGTGGNILAGYAAQELGDTPTWEKNTADFFIRIKPWDSGKFEEVLALSFQPDPATGNIITPIECDGTVGGCQKGTFYVNLNFKDPSNGGPITDDDYEKSIPKIEVIKKSTCRLGRPGDLDYDDCTKKITIPVVPRAEIRALVPLRIFKAITIARQIAQEVFAANHDRLKNVKLGVCDSKKVTIRCCDRFGKCTETPGVNWYSCAPRKKIEVAPQNFDLGYTSVSGKVCIGHNTDDAKEEHHVDLDDLAGAYYDPYENSSAKNAMKTYVFDKILIPAANSSGTANTFSDPDNAEMFVLKKNSLNNSVFSDMKLTPSVQRENGGYGSRELGDTDGDGLADYSPCWKIGDIKADLVFEEKDPIYTINSGSGGFTFTVELVDKDFRGFDYENGLSDYEKVETCPSVDPDPPGPPSCTGYQLPAGCGYA